MFVITLRLEKNISDIFYFFNIGSLLHDVIKQWRHAPPCVLRQSDIINKSGNGSFVLGISVM